MEITHSLQELTRKVKNPNQTKNMKRMTGGEIIEATEIANVAFNTLLYGCCSPYKPIMLCKLNSNKSKQARVTIR